MGTTKFFLLVIELSGQPEDSFSKIRELLRSVFCSWNKLKEFQTDQKIIYDKTLLNLSRTSYFHTMTAKACCWQNVSLKIVQSLKKSQNLRHPLTRFRQICVLAEKSILKLITHKIQASIENLKWKYICCVLLETCHICETTFY